MFLQRHLRVFIATFLVLILGTVFIATRSIPAPANSQPGSSSTTTPSQSTPTTAAVPGGQARSLGRGLIPRSTSGTSSGETPQNNSTVTSNAPANSSANTSESTRITALREQLRNYNYDPAGTSLEEANNAFTSWLASARTAANSDALEPLEQTIPVQVEYPLQICLPSLPTTGLIGVLVNPTGTVVGAPTILKSTGYPIFNQRAAEAIQQADFPTVESFVAYRFEINVKYDEKSCTPANRITQPNG